MNQLAIWGGTPVRQKPFPAWPVYDQKETAALQQVLTSGIWGTLGPEVQKFTERYAAYQGCQHGIAVVNGTVSLEIIMRGLGIGYGDEVILPPFTFYATASAVMAVGATPVFCDILSDTCNIDPGKLAACISPAARAVIVVHAGGRPCEMDSILKVANAAGIHVIEDCAHGPGSEWKGHRVGSQGSAGSFSFQGTKNLCCGEGGFISTNNQQLYEKCWSIHNSGRMISSSLDFSHYQVATNARMGEWEAAVLNAQMDRLDQQIQKREENAAYLCHNLSQIPCIQTLRQDSNITRNSYHLFIFKFLSEQCCGVSREQFIKAVTAEGIPCSQGYDCLNKSEVFRSKEFRRITGSRIDYDAIVLENAEQASIEGMWLYHAVLLGEKRDMDDIAEAFAKVYENAQAIIARKEDKL